ncbi:protein kinase family protein [Pontibacillus litoralis]|uniref:Spore coat protein YutH n=1 Tax=Pontibacillus litoralis JSM 072002 TaxID=1385512 RepID=A0A0A5G3T1_9BACI|nr:hypothetical protein [Pontibacillus litoralis]KGX86704.1 hypothetical protein N784_03655 [Pontibacillus litoralis JSM 072002]
MKEKWQEKYPFTFGRKWEQFGMHCYESGEGPVGLSLANHITDEELIEQRTICEFLHRNDWPYITMPIFTTEGGLKVTIDQAEYVLSSLGALALPPISQSPGTSLAMFHNIGTNYPYQPQHISCYGQWRTLWAEKVDAWTNVYKKQWDSHPATAFQRLFVETYPYVEGIAENALQYLQESEQDFRYGEFDQGTCTFQRINEATFLQVAPHQQVMFDHPARDIAEWIRYYLHDSYSDGYKEIAAFMHDYASIRPLSVFSWRLVYARLLFPIHLFDRLNEWFHEQDTMENGEEEQWEEMLQKQVQYEEKLGRFFESMQIDVNELKIPTIDWIV